jgi:hypothetical protein
MGDVKSSTGIIRAAFVEKFPNRRRGRPLPTSIAGLRTSPCEDYRTHSGQGALRGSRVRRRWTGTDIFTYTIADDHGETDTATVTVTIQPPQEQRDYGDALAPYPTLLSNNGAYHRILSGIYLGAGVSNEVDGRPSSNATNDTYDDGVSFPSVLTTGQTRTWRVSMDYSHCLGSIPIAWIRCWGSHSSWNSPTPPPKRNGPAAGIRGLSN